MLLKYSKFITNINEGKIIEEVGDIKINDLIDKVYNHFKINKKPVNTLDIINYVEQSIGKELDDDDYEELYYKITGEELDSEEIMDLDDEEKFIVK